MKKIFKKRGALRRKVGARSAFTVIEMLVVLGVTSVLVSIFVTQAGSLRDQIMLFKEEARLIQTLFKAKTNSIQVLSIEEEKTACGYGVYLENIGEGFDPKYVSFLRDRELDDECPEDRSELVYDETTKTEILGREYNIDSRIFIEAGSNDNFVFVPPRPEVVIDGEEDKDGFISLCLKSDPDFCRKIEVNKVGQITSK